MKTAGVVVTAGLSSRMGAFKPLLEIGEKTVILHVLDRLIDAGVAPIAVVTGFQRERLEEHLKDKKVRFIHNPRFRETQMLDSLLLGLEAVEEVCDRILITPGDVPLVKAGTVRKILRHRGDFVRPVYKDQPGHPVLLQAELIPFIKTYDGEGGLNGAVEASGAEIAEVSVTDAGITMDCDTPADFEKLKAYWEASVSRSSDSDCTDF